MVLNARLYSRGAGEGRPVTLAWRGNALEIDAGNGASWLVAAPTLALEARGFDNSQLAVRWTEQREERLLMLDAAAAVAFAQGVPASLRKRLDRVLGIQRRTGRRVRIGLAALALAIALPVAAIVMLFVKGDWIADWIAHRVPDSVEQRIGADVLAHARAQSRMIERGPANDAVQAIGRRLARPGEALRFYLADRPETNAYAAPGGVIVVYAGLLRAADTPEQVAGVLAHEIAHVELHHSLRQMVKGAGARIVVGVVFDDWDVLTNAGTQAVELMFSRDAEREADAYGLERLRAAHIDPHGLPQFLDKLLRAEGGALLPALLSTHPATRERVEALNAALGADAPAASKPIAVDWAVVKDSLKR